MPWLRRTLALCIVCAHWGAAALPCAPLLPGAPDPAPTAAAATPHGHSHAHAHDHADAASDPAWTAPCPCGCEADPAGGGPTARVGAALLPDPGEPFPGPPHLDAPPAAAAWPPAPDLRRDRVPI